MSPFEEIYDEIEKLRENIRGDEKEGRISPREAGLLLGFALEVGEIVSQLADLERKVESKEIEGNPFLVERLKEILNRLHTVGSTGPGPEGGRARIWLNEIWGRILRAMSGFLERHAEKVGVDSWSIGAIGGLPSGVSGMIYVTFKSKGRE